MKTLEKYDDLQVPGYALPYLVNGDDSGLEQEDKKIIDKWYAGFVKIAKSHNAEVIFSCNEDDGHFTWSPEFGLACDVYDCTILIVK